MTSEFAARAITIPRPQIHTGPKNLTVDGATWSYLRDAAGRVRSNQYWGSGVSALVADLLDSVAEAIVRDPSYSYFRPADQTGDDRG